MALTADQCAAFNSFLFRRVPDFDRELAKDRFPISYLYSGMYDSVQWDSFTGDTHTWDAVHVTRPNDDNDWDQVSAENCIATCTNTRKFLGWGSTRHTYVKYKREYQSPVFCFDQLRHVEMAVQQLATIVAGLKELPEHIISDFIRQLVVSQAGTWHVCGSTLTTVTPTFTADPTEYDFGGDANLPTSKLTMGYRHGEILVNENPWPSRPD